MNPGIKKLKFAKQRQSPSHDWNAWILEFCISGKWRVVWHCGYYKESKTLQEKQNYGRKTRRGECLQKIAHGAAHGVANNKAQDNAYHSKKKKKRMWKLQWIILLSKNLHTPEVSTPWTKCGILFPFPHLSCSFLSKSLVIFWPPLYS